MELGRLVGGIFATAVLAWSVLTGCSNTTEIIPIEPVYHSQTKEEVQTKRKKKVQTKPQIQTISQTQSQPQTLEGKVEKEKPKLKDIIIDGYKFPGDMDVSYAKKLLNARDEEEDRLFIFEDFIYDLYKAKVPVDYAIKLKKVRDKKGNRSYFTFFNSEICELSKAKVPVDYVMRFAKSKKSDGTKLFSLDLSGDIIKLYKANISHEKLLELMKIKTKKGNLLFDHYISNYFSVGGTKEYAEKMLTLENEKGEQIFVDESELTEFKRAKGTYEFAKKLLEFKDNKGNPVFTNSEQISKFRKVEKFYGFDKVLEKEDYDLFGYAEKLAKKGYDGMRIYRFAQLGLTTDEILNFKDTEKPNAVWILPYSEGKTHSSMKVFEMNTMVKFFNSIKKHYDIKLAIAENEKQVYETIEAMKNKDTKLLILSGHGSKKGIMYGGREENQRLDITDTDIGTYLSMLAKDAVIFLDSCSTAEGGKEDQGNFFNFVRRYAGSRTTIGATKVSAKMNLKIVKYYPFDIKTVNTVINKDGNYLVKGN